MDAEQREHERAMDEAAGAIRPLAQVVDDLVRFLRTYIVMSVEQVIVLAFWIAHTHAIDAADTTPYVHVTAPTMRSGKTRVLEVCEKLVANPLLAANATAAALLRSMAASTLLYDEVDAVFGSKARDGHEDVRALLNSGYRRGVPALRCEGQGSRQEVVDHEVFGPKMLSGIGELPSTLADRSVPIRLKRRTRGEPIGRWRQTAPPPEAAKLHGELSAWAGESIEALRAACPDLPEALDDRAQDVFEPLLAIADLAGGDWPDRARNALIALRTDESSDEEASVRLLADIRVAFEEARVDRLSTAALIDLLCQDEEGPWSSWQRDGRRLSPRSLGRLLSGFGIRSCTVRLNETETAKGFLREHFEDAWERYLAGTALVSVTSVTTASTSRERDDSYPPQDVHVTDASRDGNPHERSGVTDVTDREPSRRSGPADTPRALTVTDSLGAVLEPTTDTVCGVPGHLGIWRAKDGCWRCVTCGPPAFPGEVVESRGVEL